MNESGFILISTLFITLLLSMLLTVSTGQSMSHILREKEALTNSLLYEKAKDGFAADTIQLASFLFEHSSKSSIGSKGSGIRLSQVHYDAFGVPDFNNLFASPYHCQRIAVADLKYTARRDRRTPSSFVADMTCLEVPVSARHPLYALSTNVSLTEFMPVLEDKNLEFVLASTGSISIERLVLTGPASLFAAGDIFIHTLELASGSFLALYSASGVVQIQSMSSTANIEVLAKEGVYAAGNVKPLRSSDYLRSSMLIGLR